MKISIITVSYNSDKTIQQTIQSVLSQDYNNFEHIIIDGMSKDNTIDIVKKYEKTYNGRLKLISEKDKGIYDAMNKGIKLATGDIIGILNSDDIYANKHILSRIHKEFKNKKCDAVYGDLLFMDYDTMSKVKRKWITKTGNINLGWQPPHPTLYIKSQVYKKIGDYNIKYKIAGDYDFILRLFRDKSIRTSYIKEYLIYMRSGGVSTNGLKGYTNNLKDSHNVVKDNKVKNPYIVTFYRIVRTIKQIIICKF